MSHRLFSRLTATAAAGSLFAALLATPLPALASGTISLGHGVKCGWVLVSSINGQNTYNFICSRGA